MSAPSTKEILSAFAHPTRIFILEQADGQNMAASDIAPLIGESIPATTHHFKRLRQAGLIRRAGSQRVGSTVKTFYRSDGWQTKVRAVMPSLFEEQNRSDEQ